MISIADLLSRKKSETRIKKLRLSVEEHEQIAPVAVCPSWLCKRVRLVETI